MICFDCGSLVLAGFTYADEDTADDMFGKSHTCDHWGGSGSFPNDAFGYWTDKATGEDIMFKDRGINSQIAEHLAQKPVA